jgi:hypothetical protein
LSQEKVRKKKQKCAVYAQCSIVQR